MNSQSFVKALEKYLIPEARNACVRELASPAGQTPDSLVRLSLRYNQLTESDKVFVEDVVALATRSAVFHLLVAIDNCNSIVEDPSDRGGEFELYYANGDDRIRLGEPPDFLHDMLGVSPQA